MLDSLKAFKASLREAYPGRFPNQVRAAVQAVAAAVTTAGNSRLTDRAKVTGFDIRELRGGQKRWEAFLADASSDSFISLRAAVRADKIPDEHLDFLVNDIGWEKHGQVRKPVILVAIPTTGRTKRSIGGTSWRCAVKTSIRLPLREAKRSIDQAFTAASKCSQVWNLFRSTRPVEPLLFAVTTYNLSSSQWRVQLSQEEIGSWDCDLCMPQD